MKHLIVLAILGSLLLGTAPLTAQVASWPLCGATVMQTPAEGLPLYSDPSFRAVGVLGWLHAGDRVEVVAEHYNIRSGGLWYLVPGGYLQAYTGWQNGGGPLGMIYVIIDDPACHARLPRTFSDWWGQ